MPSSPGIQCTLSQRCIPCEAVASPTALQLVRLLPQRVAPPASSSPNDCTPCLSLGTFAAVIRLPMKLALRDELDVRGRVLAIKQRSSPSEVAPPTRGMVWSFGTYDTVATALMNYVSWDEVLRTATTDVRMFVAKGHRLIPSL